MDAWFFGVITVGGSVLLSILGMLLVRHFFHYATLRMHHEVAGYLLSVIGTLYAVLLGLVVVDTQSKYQQAKVMLETEANALADVFHVAYSYPMPVRKTLHDLIISYVDVIITDEWNSAAVGNFNEHSSKALRNIWFTINDFEPKTAKEQESYACTLRLVQQLSDARRFRFVVSKTGLPNVLWGVLIAGGILTVMFTFLFGVENLTSQILMTGLVALVLSLNVLLVALFSNPYAGDLRLKADPFLYDARIFEEILLTRPDR